LRLPPGFVERTRDLARALSGERKPEDHRDRRTAFRVDLQPLLDIAVGVDFDRELVAVWLGAGVVAAFDRAPAPGRD
jgi:hypothetical protein